MILAIMMHLLVWGSLASLLGIVVFVIGEGIVHTVRDFRDTRKAPPPTNKLGDNW